MSIRLRRLSRWRVVTLAAAAAVLAGSYPVAIALVANTGDTLLSQGRPVTASSVQWLAFPASAAVDGNSRSRWSSAFRDPQWIQIDLGVPATLTRVELDWERAYATAFTLEVSSDATAWRQLYATKTGPGGKQKLKVSGTGRYVRLNATARSTRYGVSLWEFRVFGSHLTTPPTTSAPPSSATPSATPRAPPRPPRPTH